MLNRPENYFLVFDLLGHSPFLHLHSTGRREHQPFITNHKLRSHLDYLRYSLVGSFVLGLLANYQIDFLSCILCYFPCPRYFFL